MRQAAFALAFVLSLCGVAAAQAPPPVPALPDTPRIAQYTIAANTCTCSVGFALFAEGVDVDNWVHVYIGSTRYLSTDPVFGWKLTVTPGTLATNARPITNAVLVFNAVQTGNVTILGARRPRRLSQFSESRGVAARDLNQALTDIIADQREAWDRVSRAIVGQPGETLNLLPPAATRAGSVLAFDGSGQPVIQPNIPAGTIPVNSITNSLLALMAANTIKCNNTGSSANPIDCTASQLAAMLPSTVLSYTAPGTGAVARTTGSKFTDIVSILDYGAVGDGTTDNTTAIQNAATATPIGGILLVPGYNFSMSGTLTISRPMTVQCGGANASVAGSLTATTTTADLIRINSSNVTIRDCYLNRQGTPTTGKGIAVGTDSTSITDAACTGTATITSAAQANWTSADIGKRIVVNSCGVATAALFATIVSINNPLSIVVTPAAGGTFSGRNSKYGFVYTDDVLDNVTANNHFIGVHWIDAARFRMNGGNYLSTGTGNEGMRVENQVAPDFGDSETKGGQFQSTDNTAGYAVHYLSSGGLKMTVPKFLGGKYGGFLEWNLGVSGQWIISGGSIENCATSALFLSPAAIFNNVSLGGGLAITCGNPNIVADNASAAVLNGLNISGVSCNGGGGTCVDLGKVNNATVTGVLSNTGAGTPAFNVRANALSPLLAANNIISATQTYTNASTTALIDDMVGMAFANLPTVAANGSRIFVTNGAPATSPCTGASTGALAIRQNGAWKCM